MTDPVSDLQTTTTAPLGCRTPARCCVANSTPLIQCSYCAQDDGVDFLAIRLVEPGCPVPLSSVAARALAEWLVGR